jgi:uncharacterized coiled-coil protein SlyX/opacity protein-like surface antigen
MQRIIPHLLALPIVALPLVAQAGEPAIEELNLRLTELQQRYEAQNNKLHVMEARLRQLEASGMAQPARALKAVDPSRMAAADPPAAAAQEEKVVKEAPVSPSTEAVYQEQHALFDRRFTLETGLTYSRSDRRQLTLNGFLALDAIFLGNISVDEVKADILTLDLTGRYTLSDRMQVDLNLPFLYRSTTYQSGGAGGSGTSLSEHNVTIDPRIGDVSAGFYYQLFKETANRPDVVWNVRVKAPTGSHPYGVEIIDVPGSSSNLKVPKELPSGNGVWALSTGLSFVKTLDPAILFANVGYFYNFKGDFDDIDGSTAGAQPGSVKLGDSFQYGLGTAFALNERMSLSLSYSQRFTSKAQTMRAGGDWQSIVGSGANAASLNFGVTYALTERQSLVAIVGAGLTPDAPDITVGLKFVNSF